MKDPRTVVKAAKLTEKASHLSGTQNKYSFVVDRNANKNDIKRAVEHLFKVVVTKVNTMNYAGKLKRQRTQKYGRTSSWKMAIVTLREGEKIELT